MVLNIMNQLLASSPYLFVINKRKIIPRMRNYNYVIQLLSSVWSDVERPCNSILLSGYRRIGISFYLRK